MKRHHSRRGCPAGRIMTAVRPTGPAGLDVGGRKPVLILHVKARAKTTRLFRVIADALGVQVKPLNEQHTAWEAFGNAEALADLAGREFITDVENCINVSPPRGGQGSGPEKVKPSKPRPKTVPPNTQGARRPDGPAYDNYCKTETGEAPGINVGTSFGIISDRNGIRVNEE